MDDFSEGYAAARKEDGFERYIDISGNTAIDFKYTYARPFSGGFAVVYEEKTAVIIDKTGAV